MYTMARGMNIRVKMSKYRPEAEKLRSSKNFSEYNRRATYDFLTWRYQVWNSAYAIQIEPSVYHAALSHISFCRLKECAFYIQVLYRGVGRWDPCRVRFPIY